MKATLKVWFRALRYHFVPSSSLPAVLGGVMAWALTGRLQPWFFFLTVLGVTINHIALNLTDDYFDHLAAVDRRRGGGKNPYAGGSGVLAGGMIRPTHVRCAFMLAYLATVGVGLYLSAARTWWVLAFGCFGLGSAFFYTAPPVRYGYRGLGEISHLINFSFTIGMGAYVVQTVRFSWEPFWVLMPLGWMMFAMITINEIPDERDDAAAGKKTLVVRFGRKRAVRLYGIAMALAFLVILLAPLFSMASPWILLSGLTLPGALRAYRILARHCDDPSRLAPANLLTIRVHHLTAILLIAAYLIQGVQNQPDIGPACIAASILLLFYLPAAVPVFFIPPSVRPAP